MQSERDRESGISHFREMEKRFCDYFALFVITYILSRKREEARGVVMWRKGGFNRAVNGKQCKRVNETP